jgi:dTDP-4-amino-4,6-dideoxygalactose transaminase
MNATNIIRIFPHAINLRDLLYCSNIENPILNSKQFYPYASGRAALYQSIISLNMPSGSRVLLPSFHCGVEVEAVCRAGFQIDFYNIKPDLSVDLSDAMSKLRSNTKAILLIHYFGFPQPLQDILEMCDARGLYLIEDCAHALFSKWNTGWLGSFGAIGIFSLRKTLPLPNGGGVLINKQGLHAPGKGNICTGTGLIKSTIRAFLEYESHCNTITGKVAYQILNKRSVPVSIILRPGGSEKERSRWHDDLHLANYQDNIWFLSKFLLNAYCYNDIIMKRQRNYISLVAMLPVSHDFKPVINALADGVCPLCLPVLVYQRDRVREELLKRGIETFVFGKYSHVLMNNNDYSDAYNLSKYLLGLPIHQQLDEDDMLMICEAIKQISQ